MKEIQYKLLSVLFILGGCFAFVVTVCNAFLYGFGFNPIDNVVSWAIATVVLDFIGIFLLTVGK